MTTTNRLSKIKGGGQPPPVLSDTGTNNFDWSQITCTQLRKLVIAMYREAVEDSTLNPNIKQQTRFRLAGKRRVKINVSFDRNALRRNSAREFLLSCERPIFLLLADLGLYVSPPKRFLEERERQWGIGS